MELWTQRLNVSFRRNLRFYEHRFEILRHFEESGALRDFRVSDDERVSVRLGDVNHRVGFGATQLDAALLNPNGDVGRVEQALLYTAEKLEPSLMVRPVLAFQWLEEITGQTYDEARKAAARGVFKPDSLTDFALIADGEMDDPALTYQAECGIVDGAEIPVRLAGHRSSLVEFDEDAPPSLWSGESLPEVAIYGGIACFLEARLETPDKVLELWRGTREAVERLMSELMDALRPTQPPDE